MFRKLIAILPLILVAPVAAQTAASDAYGTEYAEKSAAMSLDLSAESQPGSTTLVTKGGEPGAAATLLIGMRRVDVHLGVIGIDAWLLVDPVAVTGTMAFQDDGTSPVTFPVEDWMLGLEFYAQAASIRFDEDGARADFSNGLHVRIED